MKHFSSDPVSLLKYLNSTWAPCRHPYLYVDVSTCAVNEAEGFSTYMLLMRHTYGTLSFVPVL